MARALRLLSVVRRPDGIFAVASEGGAGDLYRSARIALSAVPESACPWLDKDARAWKALARVPTLGRRAAQAIVRALIGTVADPEIDLVDPGPLVFGRDPVDLRPQLCSADGETRLIDLLGEALSELHRDTELPPWHFERRHEIAALPAPFRLEFLWGLHLSSWTQLELCLAAYRELGLGRDERLRAAVARLVSLADRDAGLWWCDLLAEASPPTRLTAATLILESGAYQRRPDDSLRDVLAAGDLGAAVRVLTARA